MDGVQLQSSGGCGWQPLLMPLKPTNFQHFQTNTAKKNIPIVRKITHPQTAKYFSGHLVFKLGLNKHSTDKPLFCLHNFPQHTHTLKNKLFKEKFIRLRIFSKNFEALNVFVDIKTIQNQCF